MQLKVHESIKDRRNKLFNVRTLRANICIRSLYNSTDAKSSNTGTQCAKYFLTQIMAVERNIKKVNSIALNALFR